MYMISSPQSNEALTAVGVAAALGSSAAAGESPSTDAQAAGAIAKLLPELMDDVMWVCRVHPPGETAFSLPEPQCYWFSYRPASKPQQ
jgi:hypothetical protein